MAGATKCPFSYALFLCVAGAYTYHVCQGLSIKQQSKSTPAAATTLPPCKVVFVIGGPGAGKGTQCELITKRRSKWLHFSAGDLLRAERKKGGPTSDLINSKISAGQIVPAEITVGLIQAAMCEAYGQQSCLNFLIDGFPRSQGNVDAWNDQMSTHDVCMVLDLVCPEEVLLGRLLERSKTSGRQDDASLDVIRKRFQTHKREAEPIVALYGDLVQTVSSDVPVEQVYERIVPLLEPFE